MEKVKTHLSALIYYLDIKKSDLYHKTGFNYSDVKTADDLKEVIRLLNNTYYIPNYLKDI